MKRNSVHCWVSDDCGWISITGSATFMQATEVKEFGKKMMTRGIRQFAVDLEECTEIDSTFMGTLAGIALRLREAGGGRVRVMNVQPVQEAEFRKLGLDALLF